MDDPVYRLTPALVADLPGEADLPCEDEEPLGESDSQLEPLGYAYYGLLRRYRNRADVAVQADMFVHYLDADDEGNLVFDDRGNPIRRMLAPDVFVVFGVPKRKRLSYVVWHEGKPPDFVLEILSWSTWRRDVGDKKAIYARMGVTEYWLHDPVGGLLEQPLMGYRLVKGVYMPIEPNAGSPTTYPSAVLGLNLWVDPDDGLLFRDQRTGKRVLTLDEVWDANQRAEAARLRAEETARAAEEAARAAAEARRAAEQAARAAERRAADAERRLGEITARIRRDVD